MKATAVEMRVLTQVHSNCVTPFIKLPYSKTTDKKLGLLVLPVGNTLKM